MLRFRRPYFLRAWYEWIEDSGLTPYIIVDARYPKVQVPEVYVENDRITLNISSQAIKGLDLSPRKPVWTFEADFESPVGLSVIVLPTPSILAIFAHENKQGAIFEEEPNHVLPSAPDFTVVSD